MKINDLLPKCLNTPNTWWDLFCELLSQLLPPSLLDNLDGNKPWLFSQPRPVVRLSGPRVMMSGGQCSSRLFLRVKKVVLRLFWTVSSWVLDKDLLIDAEKRHHFYLREWSAAGRMHCTRHTYCFTHTAYCMKCTYIPRHTEYINTYSLWPCQRNPCLHSLTKQVSMQQCVGFKDRLDSKAGEPEENAVWINFSALSDIQLFMYH